MGTAFDGLVLEEERTREEDVDDDVMAYGGPREVPIEKCDFTSRECNDSGIPMEFDFDGVQRTSSSTTMPPLLDTFRRFLFSSASGRRFRLLSLLCC
jgi:hypothetical protein